jgi:uncharacterized protein YjcR
MVTLSDAQWQQVEQAYLHSDEPLVRIAERFAVAPATINRRRDKMGWTPRRPSSPAATGGLGVRSGDAVANRAEVKADLVDRFYRLMKLKLEQLEEDMARSSERTPVDNERETRALGTLIRNFEKVFGLEQENGKDDDKQAADRRESHAEAEAIRRELAQRLVRLRDREQSDRE